MTRCAQNAYIKRVIPTKKSLGIITQGRGSHFDPLLVDLFLENDSSFRDIFDGTLAGKE